eukprot:TRINITY_DN4466_c0_g1_i1.p1 TRINITY_DN4466_c0_g1~~TRINITY_DN4466_c0_g1_i1.p1  ORF type:complete len:244 (-),score=39.25 TRINITY_DN4466_c0_g1_i1:337-1068(-)
MDVVILQEHGSPAYLRIRDDFSRPPPGLGIAPEQCEAESPVLLPFRRQEAYLKPRGERSAEPAAAGCSDVAAAKAACTSHASVRERPAHTTLDSVVASPAISRDTDVCVPLADQGTENSKTVFVRNLPCKVGCQRMMVELKAIGLDGCYDFLHFPMKPKYGKVSFLGYGFINFMTEEAASCFMDRFENHVFDDILSNKVVRVERARERDTSAKIATHQNAIKNRKIESCMFDPEGLQAPEASS